jgi:hypothetical protein
VSHKSIWWKNNTRTITFTWFRQIRKKNRLEYGNEPDINTHMQWGVRTNGAKRGNPSHTCLDVTIMLGHLDINYTNWEFNQTCKKVYKNSV